MRGRTAGWAEAAGQSRTSGAGGRSPSAEWGRTLLSCRRHASIRICASRSELKISAFSSSSLSWPLKLSTYPFSHGLLVSMDAVLAPPAAIQPVTAVAVNAEPWSERMCPGTPRATKSSASVSTTSVESSLRVGDRLAPPGVLPLQLLQPLHLVQLEPAELLPPPGVGRLGHPDRPDRGGDGRPLRRRDLDLAPLADDRLRRVLLPAWHRMVLLLGQSRNMGWTTSEGAGQPEGIQNGLLQAVMEEIKKGETFPLTALPRKGTRFTR